MVGKTRERERERGRARARSKVRSPISSSAFCSLLFLHAPLFPWGQIECKTYNVLYGGRELYYVVFVIAEVVLMRRLLCFPDLHLTK